MTFSDQFQEINNYIEPFLKVCHQLYRQQYVCAYDGNVSLRFGDKILATPTHVCKGMLNESDLIICDLFGNKIAGNREPTSELKVHLAVYKSRPNTNCIIHAHPLYATAIYRDNKPVDTSVLTESEATLGNIPIVPHILPGTADLAEAVARVMNDNVRACMMEKHGVVVAGNNLEETYFLLTSIERLAKTEYLIMNMK